MGAAEEARHQVDAAWRAFRDALDGCDLEAPTAAGWQAKEMLAHVAFWLETVPPFVTGAFRGDPSAFAVTFPSGYDAASDEEWPAADVHNSREAAWARQQPAAAVLERAERAYATLRSFLDTVTDAEVTTHADYFREIGEHLDEHRAHELTPG